MTPNTLFPATNEPVAHTRWVTLRCPTCGHTAHKIRWTAPVGTCTHRDTPHDAKRAAVMVKVPDLEGDA